MAAPVKPQIQRANGYSAKECDLDLNDNFTRNTVEFRARAERGARLSLDYVYHPNSAYGRGPEWGAAARFGEFNPKNMVFNDPNRWEKIVWTPGPDLVSGLVKGRARFQGPGGSSEERLEILVKAFDPTVYFDLSPANTAMIHLKKKDGNTADYTQTVERRFRFSGPKGYRVRLKLAYEGALSGHIHGDYCDPVGWRRSIGEFSGFDQDGLSTFELDGSRWGTAVNYTTYGVCGKIFAKAEFIDRKTGLLHAIRDFNIVVVYRGNFVELMGSDDIELIGKNDEHPKNHFGTPALVSAIQELAAAYCKAYDAGEFNTWRKIHKNPREDDQFYFLPEKLRENSPELKKSLGDLPAVRQLQVNDMSLINGGRFDCQLKDTKESKKKPFQPPHACHMFGENVDIRSRNMNSKQREWFEKNAPSYGFRIKLENEGEENEHWHCTKL